ncbi:hypothetical protein Mal64_14710 [Pseudobythopirellula maris]|uniref:Uncharacterized protein n=1 Tax=Pseudobythopirellula maris TaxID=2527991 RepID=A0A5C5ZU37_9BACT|nr:hypothetical protein [Pseudobythopirellula maris]TWT91072.1 hypothetical protein Mal64_14710 [Pseudobythopirellula maris]
MLVSIPTIDDINELTGPPSTPAVSLYMPTHRTGRETRQDPIRLKNLLKQVESKLDARGHNGQQSSDLLAPLREISEDVSDQFWRNGGDGLVILLSDGVSKCHKLPIDVPETTLVSDHFFLNPLLKYLQGDGLFYLLAVSQNRLRLFSGTKHSLSEVELESLPDNLRDALRIDERESTLQFHSHRSASEQQGAAVYHGHGGGEGEDRKQEILQYFQRIDHALTPFLRAQKAPLVFAGVDYLFPIFQQACDYSGLMEQAVVGSPDELSADDLHPKAWELVQPRFEATVREAIDKHGIASARGQSTEDLEQIVTAAERGQIDTLLVVDRVADHHPQPEQAPPDSARPDWLSPKVLEALSLAAVRTLSHGGKVYLLSEDELPCNREATAILRY